MNAVSYQRVSGKSQVEAGGFPRQEEAVQRYATAHGMTITATFRDEGVSGTKELDARDGLTDLLASLDASGVRVVLVERADRVARDLIVGEMILAEFRRRGVKVIEAEGGCDLTVSDNDPTRKLIRQVLGAVAEFEKSCLVAKLRAARQRKKRETGKCEGRKAYGYSAAEAVTLAYMMALRYDDKLTLERVADQLNAEGHCTRGGKPWTKAAVRNILETQRSIQKALERKRRYYGEGENLK